MKIALRTIVAIAAVAAVALCGAARSSADTIKTPQVVMRVTTSPTTVVLGDPVTFTFHVRRVYGRPGTVATVVFPYGINPVKRHTLSWQNGFPYYFRVVWDLYGPRTFTVQLYSWVRTSPWCPTFTLFGGDDPPDTRGATYTVCVQVVG